jgi:hypothetical protein
MDPSAGRKKNRQFNGLLGISMLMHSLHASNTLNRRVVSRTMNDQASPSWFFTVMVSLASVHATLGTGVAAALLLQGRLFCGDCCSCSCCCCCCSLPLLCIDRWAAPNAAISS